MIDTDLERRIKDCQELLILWKNIREVLIKANTGQDITPENEAAFLQIKSEIAIRHDSFMDSLPGQQANAGQTLLDIVIRSITMKHVNKMSPADLKKIDQEWHDSFILLTETIGNLEEKRDDLAKITEFAARTARYKKNFAVITQKILGSGFLKIGILFLVVGGIFYGVDEFMWSKKADWKETPVLKAWYPLTEWYRNMVGLNTK